MPDMDPVAPWLRKTVTDFDRANEPKVEDVKPVVQETPKVIDPAAPKAEVPPVKVEEPVVLVPPVAEVAPVDTTTPTSTVPPAISSPAPVVVNAPAVPPVSTQSPTQPLK
jgi:hypothetical protein